MFQEIIGSVINSNESQACDYGHCSILCPSACTGCGGEYPKATIKFIESAETFQLVNDGVY